MLAVYPILTIPDNERFCAWIPDIDSFVVGDSLSDIIGKSRDEIVKTSKSSDGLTVNIPKSSFPITRKELEDKLYDECQEDPYKALFLNGTMTLVDVIFSLQFMDNTMNRACSVTLPALLYNEAITRGVDISEVLREALMEKLNIKEKTKNESNHST